MLGSYSIHRTFKWFLIIVGLLLLLQVYLAFKSFSLFFLEAPSFLRQNGPTISKHCEGNVSISNNAQIVNDTKYQQIADISHPCNISGLKDVISAVYRATTKECKEHIIDVACKIKEGSFYPKSLVGDCPNGNRIQYQHLGCFKDSHYDRLLPNYSTILKVSNTPKKCVQVCLQSGFIYAGTQYANECFCGNQTPSLDLKVEDENCNMKCSGNSSFTCGGYYSIDVYETGIESFVPQVAELNLHASRPSVKIAFLLTLNGRALRQVHRLIKCLYSPEHIFYIHIDSRQRYMHRELLELEQRFNNIYIAKERFSTIWGGASLLKMLLQSMKHLLNIPGKHWDYVINLSESDFPVKNIEQLVKFLTANAGKNFVKSHGRETQRFIQKQGLDKTFVECDTHMWRIGDRLLPENIQIDGGSDWLGLTRDFVKYVTVEPPQLVKGLLTIFEHTLLPAESFFHTVLRNSRFCDTYVDNNLHITNWRRKLGCKCQYKHIVDWCGCSPNDFKLEDWKKLESTLTKPIFFARKFEPVIDNAIVNKLEEWVYGAFPDTYANINSYWQNVYHHLDDFDDRNALRTISTVLVRKQAESLNCLWGNIIEINDYFENNSYRGFLITFECSKDARVAVFEMLIKTNVTGQVSKTALLSKRIHVLEVSSDMDQKEQVSRNFRKTLGSESEPHLTLKFAGTNDSNTYNFTVLWFNPHSKLAEATELYIEDATITSTHFVKPLHLTPLSTGVWLVKVLHKRNLIGVSRFLVVPEANNLTKDLNVKTLSNEGLSNLEDYLVTDFFIIRDICKISDDTTTYLNNYNNSQITDCSITKWSSIVVDPKSDINQFRYEF